MKNILPAMALLFMLPMFTSAAITDSLKYWNFGKVIVYMPVAKPDALVLFISGDGGWNKGIIKIATQLVPHSAMVAGIDIRHYLNSLQKQHSKCSYPAGDFELLSIYLQKKYKFQNYLKPIIIGYSSGATLAYGILAQAPANTFKGVISLGFCPDLINSKPLCEGTGLKMHTLDAGKSWYFEPSDKLTAPFIALAGLIDKACPYQNIKAFMKDVKNGELIALPKVGHGMSVQKNYLPYLLYAYNKVKASMSYSEKQEEKNKSLITDQFDKPKSDLPLIVFPAKKNETMPLILMISGDGGWTSFDQGVAEKLVSKGIPVIGVDAQIYFWQARTPNETSVEISKVLHYYQNAWNKKAIVLCGYSFGADIVPYLITRLPSDLNKILKSAVMMSPDPEADFEIHVTDMLSLGSMNDKYDVVAELKKSFSKNVICIFGSEEDHENHGLFKDAGATIKLLPGTHHYENDFDAIAQEIINSFR
jgi:type IV secretory pathway VirJ component